MRIRHLYITLFFSFSLGLRLTAQPLPTFNMPATGDTTVSVCKGIIYDSGGQGGQYANNEDGTFTICTGGKITLTFLQFLLELSGDDTLFIYDGSPSTSMTLINYYNKNSPGVVVANSGCMTLVFKSDPIIISDGWMAQWRSEVIPPVPPSITVTPAPSCSTTTLNISLSKKILCDSLYPSAFIVTGPVTTTVIAAIGLPCMNPNDSTDQIQLTLNQPLTQSCDYNVEFTINIPDNCDSIWTFTVSDSFLINDCPFIVDILTAPNDSICIGSCTQIEAIVTGCLSYTYNWSHGLPNTSIQTVCPTNSTIYSVTVSSVGFINTQTVSIVIIDPLIFSPPGNTVCQSEPPFNFSAIPAGGFWSSDGNGITDSVKGTFNPDSSKAGQFQIYYRVQGYCMDTFTITVLGMRAGFDQASCPGAPSFNMTGYLPPGGTWSGGGGITPGGLFDPSLSGTGTFTVTYSHPNGCSDSKQVFVESLFVNAATDSICESLSRYTLNVSPPGGRWKPATGITDTLKGFVSPRLAGEGIHHYVYKLNGCEDTAHLYIKPMEIPGSMIMCPAQSPDTIEPYEPTGGTWYSTGTNTGGMSAITATYGLCDPNAQSGVDFTDTLVYQAPNGCLDTMNFYAFTTDITRDSIFYCYKSNDSLKIKFSGFNYPSGGVWTGPGVVKRSNDYYFMYDIAGTGIHTLTYSANTCSDTVKLVVHPDKLTVTDSTVCSTHPSFQIEPLSLPATWSGTGIINSTIGIFDPSVSGAGTFPVYYSSKGGCRDTVSITVYPFAPAQISGISNQFCHLDSNYSISLYPSNGLLAGAGTSGNTFNPSIAGAGSHQIIYSYGDGFCFTSDTIGISVYPELEAKASATRDTICGGGSSIITMTTTGGTPNILTPTYTWSHGLFATSANQVSPSSTTTYIIRTSDGCSEDDIDSVTIYIHSGFIPTVTTSEIKCYGDTGSASVALSVSGSYTYAWSTVPEQTTSSIIGLSGQTYSLRISDANSTCYFDTSIRIPGYGIIKALFSPNPNHTCIPYDQNTVTLIDLSVGALNGTWEISDGTNIPYTKGQSPQITLFEPGIYTLTLNVQNEGGCNDKHELSLCIEEPNDIFIPDIFSPNGDGLNDILYVRGEISELTFIIYDRWGQKIFETNSPDIGWDGTNDGKEVQAGIYVWFINALLPNGNTLTQKGDVSLLR